MMYYVFVAVILFLAAALDDLYDGRVHDIWVWVLAVNVFVFGDIGVLQVWFVVMFAVFGYMMYVYQVWSGGDTVLFATGSFYLSSFGMVMVYLSAVLLGGVVYVVAWESYFDSDVDVRFVPVLFVAFVVSQLCVFV